MICKVCHVDKPENDFYKAGNKYYHHSCKECWKIMVLKWRKENPLREREAKRRWASKHREHNREYYARWYKENGRLRATRQREMVKEYAEEFPERISAYHKLFYRIKTGLIIKPVKCSVCNQKKRLIGHHEDYTQPLGVTWLCSSCHRLRHLELRKTLDTDKLNG
jgi:hypothetical protein